MCCLIFLGPSLDFETARAIHGDAVYLPPLRQGDLISAIHRYEPLSIGIVDGYFLQDLSVWHKEILYALHRGIAVYGSSSMGALRAAEMAAFGMHGIGRIYEDFANGVFTDDDEVALAHGPADLGYVKLSEPMVNVRATLRAIGGSSHDEAIRVAKAMHFTERNLPQMVEEWRAAGLPADELEACFVAEYVDQKREDAIALLTTLASGFTSQSPAAEAPRSLSFDALYHRDRKGSSEMEMSRIFRYAVLHIPEFEAARFHALNRTLTALFAANLGITANTSEVTEEERRFRASHSLSGDGAFHAWLRENDFEVTEFHALIEERAVCRRLHEWWLSVASGHAQRARVVLDELKLAGEYPRAARGAAQMAALASDGSKLEVHTWSRTQIASTVRAHAASTGFRLDIPIQRWAREMGYFEFDDFLTDLATAQFARDRDNPREEPENAVLF